VRPDRRREEATVRRGIGEEAPAEDRKEAEDRGPDEKSGEAPPVAERPRHQKERPTEPEERKGERDGPLGELRDRRGQRPEDEMPGPDAAGRGIGEDREDSRQPGEEDGVGRRGGPLQEGERRHGEQRRSEERDHPAREAPAGGEGQEDGSSVRQRGPEAEGQLRGAEDARREGHEPREEGRLVRPDLAGERGDEEVARREHLDRRARETGLVPIPERRPRREQEERRHDRGCEGERRAGGGALR
jgi:hypothetical protein